MVKIGKEVETLRFASRNLFRHRVRTGLSLGTIVFGVASLILSGGFIEDVFYQLREATIHSQLGHLQIQRAGYSKEGRRRPFRYLMEKRPKIIDELQSWPEVSDVLMRINFSALANNLRADLPVIVQGVEPSKEARLGSFLTTVKGRELTDTDVFGMAIGEGVASALNLEPGDPIILLTNTPDGALNSLDFRLVGIFRSFSKDYDSRAVRIPLLAAQELLVSEGMHSLVVSLRKTEYTKSVAERLKENLTGQGLEIRTWYDLADFYQKTVKLYKRQFGVLQVIILVMVVLIVVNSVNMAVFERTGEFGTQMALGDRGTDIFKLIMIENTLLGAFGATSGCVLGVILAWAISQVGIPMPPPPNSNAGYIAYIRIVPSVVATAFAVGFVATVLAAILPARRASRLPVVDALRHNV